LTDSHGYFQIESVEIRPIRQIGGLFLANWRAASSIA
jgi:hypothetical protein